MSTRSTFESASSASKVRWTGTPGRSCAAWRAEASSPATTPLSESPATRPITLACTRPQPPYPTKPMRIRFLTRKALILRSRAKRGVSKDGPQSWCCPPFETRPAGAPQGEVVSSIMLWFRPRGNDVAGLSLRSVKKSFGEVEVVHGVDLEIADREVVVFVGPSGCGKSTLLRMIAGLEDITA